MACQLDPLVAWLSVCPGVYSIKDLYHARVLKQPLSESAHENVPHHHLLNQLYHYEDCGKFDLLFFSLLVPIYLVNLPNPSVGLMILRMSILIKICDCTGFDCNVMFDCIVMLCCRCLNHV